MSVMPTTQGVWVVPKEKPTRTFNLTGSLKAKVEETYEPRAYSACLCEYNNSHKEWCVYGPERSEEGITSNHLLNLDGWSLSQIKYDASVYGGLMVPDRYEITHLCPVALWRIELQIENKKVLACRACCEYAPDELIAVYHLHRP